MLATKIFLIALACAVTFWELVALATGQWATLTEALRDQFPLGAWGIAIAFLLLVLLVAHIWTGR